MGSTRPKGELPGEGVLGTPRMPSHLLGKGPGSPLPSAAFAASRSGVCMWLLVL